MKSVSVFVQLVVFFTAVSAYGFDLLGGEDKPRFVPNEIRKQCGGKHISMGMRVVFQPRMDMGSSAKPVTEMVFTSDDPRGPRLAIASDKLLKHLKAKKLRFVNVVYTLVKENMVTLPEAKPCLIDGMPITYWVGQAGD